ncbi:MAG: sigma-70 family RNA polymerase sigma factor [Deltaproteobacteria bacterium]
MLQALFNRMDDDSQLVRRAREGDKAAYRVLVERYQRRIHSFVLTILKDPDDADDVAQEAFLKAYRGLASFKGEAGFFTWLYRIANNLAIDLLRRRGHLIREELDDAIFDEGAEAAAGGILGTQLGQNPAETMLRGELAAKLEEALAQLPEKHRAILVLREVDGLSYEEISEALDIPKGTVMSRLFHARGKMQRILADYLGEPARLAPVNSDGRRTSKA